jgi:hypothetical protein
VEEESVERKPRQMFVNPDGRSAMVARQSVLIQACVDTTWDELRRELRFRQHAARLSDDQLAKQAHFSVRAMRRLRAPLPEDGPSLHEVVRWARAGNCEFQLTRGRDHLGAAPVRALVADGHLDWSAFETERIKTFLKSTRVAYGISKEDLDDRIGAHTGCVKKMEEHGEDPRLRYVLATIHAMDIGLVLLDRPAAEVAQ